MMSFSSKIKSIHVKKTDDLMAYTFLIATVFFRQIFKISRNNTVVIPGNFTFFHFNTHTHRFRGLLPWKN